MAIKKNFGSSQAGLIMLGNPIPIIKRQSAGNPKSESSRLEQLAQGDFSCDNVPDEYVQEYANEAFRKAIEQFRRYGIRLETYKDVLITDESEPSIELKREPDYNGGKPFLEYGQAFQFTAAKPTEGIEILTWFPHLVYDSFQKTLLFEGTAGFSMFGGLELYRVDINARDFFNSLDDAESFNPDMRLNSEALIIFEDLFRRKIEDRIEKILDLQKTNKAKIAGVLMSGVHPYVWDSNGAMCKRGEILMAVKYLLGR